MPPSASLPVTVRLLGDPALVGPDGSVKALERRAAGLLALVALEPGVTRARAAVLLWPDSDNARQALRQQIARFRRNYGAELVRGDDSLRLADGVTVDALSGAAGELLGGLGYDDCDDFAFWLSGQRQRRRGQTAAEIGQLLAAAEAQGDWEAAVKLAEQLLLADNEAEVHHRTLMRLHYLRGDIAQAQGAYERLSRLLRTRFGAPPSPQTEELARTLRAAQPQPAPAARAAPVALLRPPRLVGRAPQMAQLEQVWRSRSAAVVFGEGGMGKSRLIGDLAQAQGGALHAAARPGDADLPYALVTRLARAALRALRTPPAPGVARELARLLPELGEATPLASDVDRARFLAAIDALLAQAAREGTQALVLDDLQYADAASVEALRHAAAEPCLAWIVALRPAEAGVAAQVLVDALARLDGCVQLTLAPLAEREVAELLESLDLDSPQLVRMAPQLARHSGGNPLFLLETIKTLWLQPGERDGAQGGALSLPVAPSVAGLIGRRMARLAPRSLDLARCAAVAGQDFGAELAAAVLAVRAVDLADAWTELEAGQVFRDGGFAHDLIYEAALASVPQPVAAAMHAAIAEWLAAHEGAPARVAHHYDRAGRSARAAPFWITAGQQAQAALRFVEATDAFERAALGHAAGGHGEAAFEAAYAMRQASFEVDLDQRSAAALDLLERFAATPVQQARACNERAVTRLHQGDLAGAESCAQAGLRALGGADAPLLRAELRRNLAAVHVWRNETHAALAELRSIEHDLERLAPAQQRAEFQQSLAIVLDHVDEVGAARQAHEKAIALMLELGNVPGAAQTALNLAVGQHDTGDAQGALATLERARLLLAAVPEQRRSYSSLDLNCGFVLAALGEYEAALRHLDQAVDSARTQTPGWMPLMHAYRAQVWLHLGQPARAHQELAAARPAPGTPAAARSKWTVVQAQLAAGVPGAGSAAVTAASGTALAQLDALLVQLPAQGRRLSLWRPRIARLALLSDALAAQDARSVLDEVGAAGRTGLEITAGAHLAERLTRLGQVDAALPVARRTLALLEHAVPDNQYRGEVWRQCLAALSIADPPAAAQVLRRAVAWVDETAQRRVPPSFRASFLEHNAANRELRRAATRLAR